MDQRAGRLCTGNGFADRDALYAGNGDDLARPGVVNINSAEPFKTVQLGDACLLGGSVQLDNSNLVPAVQSAGG